MKGLRWIVVFCFCVAAELLGPVATTPVEMLDGEAEESIQAAGHRRVDRRNAEPRIPAAAEVDAHARASAYRAFPHLARTRANPVRKVPAPVPESPPAPEDH